MGVEFTDEGPSEFQDFLIRCGETSTSKVTTER
jgi:hypothetical protein